MRKFLVKLLFNKNERQAIWNALSYSGRTYRRRNSVEEAIKIQIVMNKFEKSFGVTEKKFTEDELYQAVEKAINIAVSESTSEMDLRLKEVAEQAFESGRASVFIQEITKDHIPTEEKCSECDEKETCELAKTVLGKKEQKQTEEESDKEEAPEVKE